MADTNDNELNYSNLEYTITTKNSNDIILEVTDDPKERLLYQSIIESLEETAAEAVKNDKIAQIPFIGSIRKNPIRKIIQSNHVNFSIAKKHMNSSEYKDHVRCVIEDAKEKQAKIDYDNNILKKVKSINRKKYDKYYLTLGKAYAEMFIKSILMLKVIEYDVEVQTHYDNLNGL